MEVDLEKTVVHSHATRSFSRDFRPARKSLFGELTPTGEFTLRGAKLTQVPKEMLEGLWDTVLHLDLRENEIESLDHSPVLRLSQLRTLDLRQNRLEYIPDDVSSLQHLKVLRLDGNLISSLPRCIWQMASLETLTAADNSLFAVPADIQQLTRLKALILSQNRLLELPSEIGELRCLVTLHIHGNEFSQLPTSLQKLLELKELSLEWFRYTSPPLSRVLKGHIGEKMIGSLQTLCMKLSRHKTDTCSLVAFLKHFSEGQFLLSSVDSRHKSVLHLAAMEGDCGVIKGLIEGGIPLDGLDKEGYSAFGLALHYDKLSAAKLLLSHDPDVNIGAGAFGTPLHLAVQKVETWLVRDLLRKGANACAQDRDGNTPLHTVMAIFSKSPRQCVLISDMLLNAGCSVNTENNEKNTPLHLAIKRGQTDAVRWAFCTSSRLAKQGREEFNFSARGRSGMTPLHVAAHGGNFDIVCMLLESGKTHALVKSQEGLTPRHVAKKDIALIKYLMRAEMEKLREQRTSFDDCSFYDEEMAGQQASKVDVLDSKKPLSERYSALYSLFYSKQVKDLRELAEELDPNCALLQDLVYLLSQLDDSKALPTLERLASSPAAGSVVLKEEALNAVERIKGVTPHTHVIRSIMGPKLQRSEQLLRNSYSVKAFATFSSEDTKKDDLLFM